MNVPRSPLFGAVALIVLAAAGPATADDADPAVTGDANAGEMIFNKNCKVCHELLKGVNKHGPSLHGVIGRPSASAEKFRYSEAMKSAQFLWSKDTIAKYLADPKGFVPKNKMSFNGLGDPRDIQNLIAFIERESAK